MHPSSESENFILFYWGAHVQSTWISGRKAGFRRGIRRKSSPKIVRTDTELRCASMVVQKVLKREIVALVVRRGKSI